MSPSRSVVVTIGLGALLVAGAASPAFADPVKCQKDLVKSLLKLKNTYLKKTAKCLDNQNVGKISGPCPDDAATALKIQTTRNKVVAKIATSCPDPDLATLGFPADCQLQTPTSAAETLCAALPGGTATEFATCLACWKEAEFAEYMATLYASHAVEVCDTLGATSTVCSSLDCTTPLPDQRDLGDTGENDCQKAIGKAGVKHLLTIEKALEKCGLAGGTRAACLADLKVQVSLDKSALKLDATIKNKCGNRDPVPNVPFCCRTGMGNACTAVATRDDCELLDGDVQDNKVCGLDNNCDPTPGQQQLTWWGSCPISDSCPGTPVTTLEHLIDCVGATADEIAAELLCIQFPSGWGPCPGEGSPSGAFLG